MALGTSGPLGSHDCREPWPWSMGDMRPMMLLCSLSRFRLLAAGWGHCNKCLAAKIGEDFLDLHDKKLIVNKQTKNKQRKKQRKKERKKQRNKERKKERKKETNKQTAYQTHNQIEKTTNKDNIINIWTKTVILFPFTTTGHLDSQK